MFGSYPEGRAGIAGQETKDPSDDGAEYTPRPMVGLLALLTQEQRSKALAWRGSDNAAEIHDEPVLIARRSTG